MSPTSASRTKPDVAFIPFPRAALDRSIPDRFAEQVARHPDRIAIGAGGSAGGQTIAYHALGQKVERIARGILARLGAAPAPVALLFDQGAPLVAATLGVLAAGKFYVPLDPTYPRAHLLAMLGDLQPRLLLTDRGHRDLASGLVRDPRQVLALDEIDTQAIAAGALPRVPPDALAYIYYTSGSTGRAKGVGGPPV